MSKTLPNGIFPSQAVSDSEKASYNYGLDVASAIETEWFRRDSGDIRFFANRDNFHRLRLYARGEQSIQKYKDELSINGDLSYLNIDWKPVPIIPKFVDIVVNGINDRLYEIKAYSQDQLAISKRSSYVNGLLSDMYARDYKEAFKKESRQVGNARNSQVVFERKNVHAYVLMHGCRRRRTQHDHRRSSKYSVC